MIDTLPQDVNGLQRGKGCINDAVCSLIVYYVNFVETS